MELRRLVYAIVHKWWLIVLLAVLSGGLGYYFNIYLSHPNYSANSTLYVLDREKIETGQALSFQDLTLSQEVVKQYSGIFYSRAVLSSASKKLSQYNISPEMLSAMVSLSSQLDSNLLSINAIASDPIVAAAVANAMGEEFTSFIRDLTKSDYIGILDEAQAPRNPMPDNGIVQTLIWLLAGLVIAFGSIYVIEYFDTTIRSAEDIEVNLNLRVIGIIPEHDIR